MFKPGQLMLFDNTDHVIECIRRSRRLPKNKRPAINTHRRAVGIVISVHDRVTDIMWFGKNELDSYVLSCCPNWIKPAPNGVVWAEPWEDAKKRVLLAGVID